MAMRKMTMKLALARTLFPMMLLPTAVLAQTNAYASGYFLGPDGSLALVNIIRAIPYLHLCTSTVCYFDGSEEGLF
jgi:hypothetical protein